MKWFYKPALLLACLPLWLPAQTKVNLQNQSKNIDFSSATSVRPMKTGTVLPATCNAGEMFFKTDAPAGANTYGCIAPNTWVSQGTPTPGMLVIRSSNTVLSVGVDCGFATPCRVRIGSVVYSFLSPATATVTSGAGLVYIYVNNAGAIVMGTSSSTTPALNCSGCSVVTSVTQFPVDSVPIGTWNVTTGTWDALGVDSRAVLDGPRSIQAGQNVSIAETPTSITISASSIGLPTGSVVNGTALRMGGSIPASTTDALLAAGPAMSGGNSSGTVLGLNTPSGFTGDVANWQLNGSSVLKVNSLGELTVQNGLVMKSAQVAMIGDGSTTALLGNYATTANSSARIAVLGSAATNQVQVGTGLTNNSMIVNGLGKLSIGTTAPNPSTSASGPDLLIKDNTPTSGSTQMQLQAGAGQNRDLLQFLDSSGTVNSRISPDGAIVNQPSGTKPTCAVGVRGMMWHTQSASGTADKVEVCVKNAANSYLWFQIF